MSNLIRQTSHPLDDLFRGFFVKPMELPASVQAHLPQQIRMDVKEQPEAYEVHAELPGARKEDIHVEVDGNQVSIRCEVREQSEAREGERVLRSERYFGQVARSFQVASDIDDAAVKASFKDGVLSLYLPKRKAAPASRRVVID